MNNTCPACNSDKIVIKKRLNEKLKPNFISYSQEYYDGFLESMIGGIEVELMKCLNCDHYSYSELPSQELIKKMYEAYANRYLNKSKSSNTNPQQNQYKQKILKALKRVKPNADSFLDFGAGNCAWSSLANNYFNVTAFDKHIDRMIDSKDFNIESNYENIKDKTYDIVFCNQVLEHVVNPDEVMKSIRQICHKDSIIFISVPNTQGEHISKLEGEWPYNGKTSHIMAPFQHIQGYSQKSLETLSYRNNFEKVNLVDYARFSFIDLMRSMVGRYLDYFSTTTIILKINN